MAKPTNHMPILAHPEPHSLPLQPSMPSSAPPLIYASSILKSKPHLHNIASVGDHKLSNICKLGFDETKEALANDVKALCLAVKEKELKESQKRHSLQCLRPTFSLLRKGGRRQSFAGSLVELNHIFAKNGVKVVSVDMPSSMQIHAVDCARKAHDSMEKFTSKSLALSLKREFDGVYGPAWHCIVGTSFGSFVTHSVGGFLYFSMDQKLYVLLFKTSVQKAD